MYTVYLLQLIQTRIQRKLIWIKHLTTSECYLNTIADNLFYWAELQCQNSTNWHLALPMILFAYKHNSFFYLYYGYATMNFYIVWCSPLNTKYYKIYVNRIFSENIQSEISLCVVIFIAKYCFWITIKIIQVTHNLVSNAVFREYHLCVFHIDDDCIQDDFSWQVSWKLLASKIFWQPHAVCHNIVYL